MCGIAGVFELDTHSPGPVEPFQAVDGAISMMLHRGPDDRGIIKLECGRGEGYLGACRLAVQDLSMLGHMPMTSESGVTVIFNGEVYNYRDLRSELCAKGLNFRSDCDTEVVLRAYEAWGLRAFRRFRGMFALAIWDARRQQLHLARDGLGIKPLYVQQDETRLAFGSELTASMKAGLFRAPAVSEAAVYSYLSLGAPQEPLTIFESCQSLPPGIVLTWTPGRPIRREAFWDLRAAFEGSDEASPVSVRRALEEAVCYQLVSDAPLGVFLSGGIDSTVLTGIAAPRLSQPLKTVSLSYEETAYNEDAFIDLVTARYGCDHDRVHVSSRDVLEWVGAAVDRMDQPSFDGVNTFIVSRAAREVGLTVVLSGLGADELFGGYDTFRLVPRLERLERWRVGRAARIVRPVARLAASRRDPWEKAVAWLTQAPSIPSAYLARRNLFAYPEDLLVRGEQARIGTTSSDLSSSFEDSVNGISYAELVHYMRNVLLRDSDAMSMANSVELRVPFLDQEFVTHVAAIRGNVKWDGVRQKPLLVDACRDLLPTPVVTRSKMGFTLPYAKWLRDPLRGEVEAALLDPQYGRGVAHMLDHRVVAATWNRFLKGRTGWTRPWALYVLKRWAETNLSRPLG